MGLAPDPRSRAAVVQFVDQRLDDVGDEPAPDRPVGGVPARQQAPLAFGTDQPAHAVAYLARWLSHSAAPEAGVELELAVRGEAPLQIRVVDRSEGPPELPEAPYTPRPADMMPSPSGWLVLRWIAPTFVGRTFELR